jgi:predicted enzyme related to lactoylglutathione lyase
MSEEVISGSNQRGAMTQPIVHYAIAAKDGKKLHSFYESLLGWKFDATPMPSYEMIDGKQGADFGINGGIYQVEPGDDQPGIRIYANVDSAEAYMAKVEGLGGKVIVPSMEPPGAGIKIGLFADPEDNVVGVVETRLVR